MRPFTLLAVSMLLLGLPLSAPGADGQEILSFADALSAEEDHYRAITEYKRFLHLFPDDPAAPAAHLAIAGNYFDGRRWDEAEETAARIVETYPGTPEAGRAARLHADIAFRRGDYASARRRYNRLLQQSTDPREQRALRYRIARSYLEADRFAEAREVLAQMRKDPDAQLEAELARLCDLPLKRPPLAGALSAALPGAGQVYAGRHRDAALAFALNAAFLWGALNAFQDGNEAAGAILLFFEAGWYTGNIFNAVNSTYKYNRDLREEAKAPLRERFGTAPGRDGIPSLGLAFRF